MAKRTKKPLEFRVFIRQAAKGGVSRIMISGRLKTRLLRCLLVSGDTWTLMDEAVPGVMISLLDAADVLSNQEGVKVTLWFDVQTSYFASPDCS